MAISYGTPGFGMATTPIISAKDSERVWITDTEIGIGIRISSSAVDIRTERDGEIMRLDKDGMTYKGKLIEDGGEAYRAFLKVMGKLKG
jgi:hypothetical protein